MNAYSSIKYIENKFDGYILWTVMRKKHRDPSQGAQKAKRTLRCMNPTIIDN